MSVTAAIDFVREHGTDVEQARMDHVMTGDIAHFTVAQRATVDQKEDGGWPAPWSDGHSSLDATCFRISEVDQLGFRQDNPIVSSALDFIESRISADGWLEEAAGLNVPDWLAYGQERCRAYLTSNGGFWLATHGRLDAAQGVADWLGAHVYNPFDMTRWLAAGLFWQLGETERERSLVLLDELLPLIGSMPITSVAWMGWTLLRGGVLPQHPVLISAAERLAHKQKDNGGWSEDASLNVHSTIEAGAVLWAVREGLR